MKIFLNQRCRLKELFGYLSIYSMLGVFMLTLISNKSSAQLFAQAGDTLLSSNKLKRMSLEELMNVEVTSVSGQSEKLTEVASAIQVLTSEDIRRSSASRLPNALRLSPNLQMAQVNSHDYSITARGFSGSPTSGGILADKLLATIDGRSIYSPLFAGVYWDVQNIMLEDVDRIEVVSGPGGTLWGANAVNGIISIKTKSAKETQGLYVSESNGGSLSANLAEARYGGKVGENTYFRFYGQRFDKKESDANDTTKATNNYNMNQGGFRIDNYMSEATTITLQGDFYSGNENSLVKYATISGQNVLGRLTHVFSEKSDLSIQMYGDHTTRKTPESGTFKNPQETYFNYELTTYDIDIKYHFPIGKLQSILMGVNARDMRDNATGGSIDPKSKQIINAFDPANKAMPLTSGFIQDEITIKPEKLKMTIGSKFLTNVFTGNEIQPSARIALTPNKLNTVWAAVSHAVRIPSRFDVDISILGTRLTPGGYKSEKITAYELGYRVRPIDKLSFSFATFYNQYTDLRSLNTSTNAFKIVFANNQKAKSYGIEVSGNYQAFLWWRMRGGYTYLNEIISSTSPDVVTGSAGFEGVEPKNQFMLQSIMDLPKEIQFDLTGRYISELPSKEGTPVNGKPGPSTPFIPAYYTCDARIARQFNHIELSIIGRNLLAPANLETGIYTIPRSIYAKIICRF